MIVAIFCRLFNNILFYTHRMFVIVHACVRVYVNMKFAHHPKFKRKQQSRHSNQMPYTVTITHLFSITYLFLLPNAKHKIIFYYPFCWTFTFNVKYCVFSRPNCATFFSDTTLVLQIFWIIEMAGIRFGWIMWNLRVRRVCDFIFSQF